MFQPEGRCPISSSQTAGVLLSLCSASSLQLIEEGPPAPERLYLPTNSNVKRSLDNNQGLSTQDLVRLMFNIHCHSRLLSRSSRQPVSLLQSTKTAWLSGLGSQADLLYTCSLPTRADNG